MLLANLAIQVQKSNIVFEYDAANMKISNHPEANDLFHYECRQGWTPAEIQRIPAGSRTRIISKLVIR